MTIKNSALFAKLLLASLMTISLVNSADSRASNKDSADLRTVSEKSAFQETGRYAEVVDLCKKFAANFPKAVRCIQFGSTPEGRPMMALVATRTGVFSAQAAQQKKIPVVLIQGGIHAGEIDGKDAGFLALREALNNNAAQDALDKQILIFVPVFNVDGHERFGRWNRPNQRGPEAMGWRTTAQNFNLNRDYLKADTPEMQAMLKLVNQWDPIAVVDLHVTDGAKFEHDISIQVEPSSNSDNPLAKIGSAFQSAVIADLAKQGSLPVHFYMSFNEEDNPMSGFSNNVSTARFSTGYFQLRNRLGMLVETHSWKDYSTRVRITRNTIISVLNQVAQNGKVWREFEQQEDQASAKLAAQTIALTYKNTASAKNIDFRGYAYTRSNSEVSGALMTHYDESKPQIWKVKLQDEVEPNISVRLPEAGYIVPAEHADRVAKKLLQHDIIFYVMKEGLAQQMLEVFRADKTVFSSGPNESHQMLLLTGNWKPESRSVSAGSLYIPVAQAKLRLIAAMFEPSSGEALVNWGWFNAAFEMKEYMEAYVAEDFAREQLASNPKLKQEFEQQLSSDPEFAKDPAARLEFFARRHISWDEKYRLYPILRIAKSPL